MKYYLIVAMSISLSACKNDKKTDSNEIERKNEAPISELKITPIEHATMVIEHNGTSVFIDPTGGKEAFDTLPKADYVLITDIHSDHMHLNTLESLDLKETILIVPKAVAEKLPSTIAQRIITISNGDSFYFKPFSIEAIPMYNLREEALKHHPKGRGNGYVLTFGKERVYISGDTEDIPEMRQLENIDKAFICMNLPYTMTVDSAIDAVLAFKPKQVYPYHYRGTEGYSDVERFKLKVSGNNKDIEVVQLDWYPNASVK